MDELQIADRMVQFFVGQSTAAPRPTRPATLEASREPGDEVPKLLTESELSALLQIKEITARVWRQKGTGPRWIKVGRLIRYAEPDVQAWLDERARGGKA